MKIVQLESENVKCLKAINIKPDGSVVVVGGDNANGKSSVLDSIEYALGGTRTIPDKPIRHGQEKAKIVLDLGDLVVTRTFTKNGSNLVVKNKDGSPLVSPQAMLDKLVGNLSFDPLDFSRMDSKRQLETLKSLVGLDFTELDSEYKQLFNERTEVNRRGKELKAQFDAIESNDNVPSEELSLSDLSNELLKGSNHNKEIDNLESSIKKDESDLKGIEEQIVRLQKRQSDLSNKVKQYKKQLAKMERVDIDSITQQISQIEATNTGVRQNNEKIRIEKELTKLRNKSVDLSTRLEEINNSKQESLQKAKFPVKGLGFSDSDVTYNDLPFSQCSSAEKIKISVAMGLAMNPKLKVLLIRDGSLLDDKGLEIVAKMAEKSGSQVWIERVGKGSECTVIIQDGEIVTE